jgi:aryl-alcohol dehydrogenase-like predicted oxidoreductase
MRYTSFGHRTGLRVSEYALGTGNFGTGWGAGADDNEARKIFERFVEHGGNFIDTADVYQFGQSEKLVGEFVRSDRHDFVLSTKYTIGASPQPRLSGTGNARKNMRTSVEESLRRLNTDYIDLFWVHYPDGLTPIEEVLRGIDDLVTEGKVLYGAFSNFPAWRVARAATIADLARWAPVAGIQVEYSLVERSADRELLPMAEALGLGITLWSPLGGGLLTGKYRISTEGRLTDLKTLVHTESTTQKTAILDVVLEIAAETERPPAQVATAWVNERSQRSTATSIPIIGPRSVAQLDDYLGALDLGLTPEQFERLTEVSSVPLGVPHEANAASMTGINAGQQFLRGGANIPPVA